MSDIVFKIIIGLSVCRQAGLILLAMTELWYFSNMKNSVYYLFYLKSLKIKRKSPKIKLSLYFPLNKPELNIVKKALKNYLTNFQHLLYYPLSVKFRVLIDRHNNNVSDY